MDTAVLCGGVETLPDDEEVVRRVRAGDTALYGLLVRRYELRLRRIASGILRDGAEAEDAVQDAYLQAFSHLHQFAGRSSFSTWLTRIAISEAVGRRRRRQRAPEMMPLAEPASQRIRNPRSPAPDPERQALDQELSGALNALARLLPRRYRSVFVLREIEEMSTSEAARKLRLSPECVKTRLHRARLLLRHKISKRIQGGNAKYQRLPIALLANRSSCQRVAALIPLKRNAGRAFRVMAGGRGKVIPLPAPGRRALYLRSHTVSPEAAAS
jgi:RNA polymerase sigma-70 factor (ECF subfamily)